MIVRDIIQRILSLYSKGVQSDDSRLKRRHVYNKMLTVRTRLVSDEAKKKQKINQWNYQTLPCVELIVAPSHECPCLPPIGCKITRSKYPLPKPLTDLNKHLIQSVTSIEGSVIFSEVSWAEKKYKAGAKYTANKPDYYIHNGYLYLTHRQGIKAITVVGLFEDPIIADNFPSICDDCIDCTKCNSPLDMDFPLDMDKIDVLIEMVANELIILFNQNPEDLSNNTQDNVPETSK